MQITARTAHRAGLALGGATALLLLWAIGALGVIGAEGDPIDLLYLGVLGVVIGGAAGSRLESRGMARAMLAAVVAVALVAVVALLLGEHRSPVTSVVEILGVNGLFMGLLGAAGRLLRSAAGPPRWPVRADT